MDSKGHPNETSRREPSLAVARIARVRRRRPSLALLIVAGLCFIAAPAGAFHFPWDQGHDTFTPEEPPDDQEPPSDEPEQCSLDPIDMRTGEFFWSNTPHDIFVSGLGPQLDLRFTYHSRDKYDGPFGLGWHAPLMERVAWVTDGDSEFGIVRDGHGRRKRYQQTDSGAFIPPPGESAALSGYEDGSMTLAREDGTVYEFSPDGSLAAVTDRLGRELTAQYDSFGRLTVATDFVGRSLTFAYGPNGKVSLATDPAGRQWSFSYDAQAHLTSVTDPLGSTTTYGYTSGGLLRTVTDARGNLVVQNTYDADGRVIQQTLPDGTSQIIYENDTQTRIVDPLGRSWIYEFSECCGLPTGTIDPLGRHTVQAYDEDRNLISSTDANGHQTLQEFDSFGNAIRVIDPTGATAEFAYIEGTNLLQSARDPNGNLTIYSYDSQNRLTQIEDALSQTTLVTYNSDGLVVAVQDPLGGVISYEYTTAGYVSKIIDPEGSSRSFTYDALGNVLSLTDGLGQVSQYAYDARNRVTQQTLPNGTTVLYAYDPNGNMTSVTDPKGNLTQFEYDSLNRLTRVVDPLGRSSLATYDSVGRLASLTDRNGAIKTFTYDAADRLVRTDYSDGDFATFQYDNVGNLLGAQNQDSGLDMQYDEANRLVASVTTASASQPAATVAFDYDDNGNCVQREAMGRQVVYAYDALNRLSTVSLATDLVATYQYDALGRRVGRSLGNGIDTVSQYDSLANIERYELRQGASLLEATDYSYDLRGSLLQADLTGSDSRLRATRTFEYDALDRLLGADHPLVAEARQAFSYDDAGNRLSGGGIVGTAQYDAANRLLQDDRNVFEYDFEGNCIKRTDTATGVVTTYSYTIDGQLSRIASSDGRVADFTYDPLGRRIQKVEDGQTVQYVYDLVDVVLEFRDGAALPRRHYVHGRSYDEPVVVERDLDEDGTFESSDRRFFVGDRLGSVTTLFDAAGTAIQSYAYDADGRVVLEDGGADNAYRYTGREYESDFDLYYYRSRYYDPSYGRFLNEDRAGSAGGLNRYIYVINNPLKWIDPLGTYVKNPSNINCLGYASGAGSAVYPDVAAGDSLKDTVKQLGFSCTGPGSGECKCKCDQQRMVVYVYKYRTNPGNSDPWKDPWIRGPGNDYHAIKAAGGCKGDWTYVPHNMPKTDPKAKPQTTPDPTNPDSYWSGNVPSQRYCCCK